MKNSFSLGLRKKRNDTNECRSSHPLESVNDSSGEIVASFSAVHSAVDITRSFAHWREQKSIDLVHQRKFGGSRASHWAG